MCKNPYNESISRAAKFNNAGTLQFDAGDSATAMLSWNAAIKIAREALNRSDKAPGHEHALQDCARMIELEMTQLEKVGTACTLSTLRMEENRSGQTIHQEARITLHETVFISDAIKIKAPAFYGDGCDACYAQQRCYESETSMATILHNMGLVHYKTGNFDRAQDCIVSALEYMPDDTNEWNHPRMSIFLILYNNLGHICRMNGQNHASLVAFEEASLRSGLLITSDVLANDCHQQEEKDIEVVLRCAEAVFFNLGFVYFLRGELKLAVECFGEASTAGRNVFILHNIIVNLKRIGQLYLQRSKFSDAAYVFNEAMRIHSRVSLSFPSGSYADTFFNLGYALHMIGEHEKAVSTLLTANQLLNDSKEVNCHMHLILQQFINHLLLFCNHSPAA